MLEPGVDFSYSYTTDFNDVIDAVQWSLDGQVICDDCREVTVNIQAQQELCARLFFDNENCYVEDCFLLNVMEIVEPEDTLNFYVPTAFSPEGTPGRNDEWILFTNFESFTIDRLEVYDRWGNLVHLIDNQPINESQTILWDGRIEDTRVNSGVYLYRLEITAGTQSVQNHGQLTIVR